MAILYNMSLGFLVHYCIGGIIIHIPYIILLSLVISFLNIFDGIATHFGLLHNKIEELNPIMDFLWVSSHALFLTVKMMLSLSISYLSYLVYRLSGTRFQKLYTICLSGILILYLAIFSIHLYWLIVL
ncbi:DUF5658 family protein [Lysinibacillus sp. NPDC093712]|uniref:DUF5658 family protein n=1 Tax=Lysinibacillus sp. NPDC093712 TaxID=3390579 RepID=UPI003D079EDA